MNNSQNTSAYYYIIVISFAVVFCSALIAALDWPALAEIPLAISLFIQIIVLSKSVFNSWAKNREEYFENILSKTKALFFSLDTQEEEINIWDRKNIS